MSPFTFVANRIDRFVLPLVSRHALAVLKREYACTTAHQILWHAWDAFGSIAARIAARRPPGTRVMLSFAAAAALHRAMLHAGAAESHATAVREAQGARGAPRTLVTLRRMNMRIFTLAVFGVLTELLVYPAIYLLWRERDLPHPERDDEHPRHHWWQQPAFVSGVLVPIPSVPTRGREGRP